MHFDRLTFNFCSNHCIQNKHRHCIQLIMELTNALSMQGPLEKQSPNLFKIFQERYFAVRSQGQFLVWFKKKPDTVDQKPQGILQFNTIDQCIPDQYDQTIFRLIYGDRQFVLRAESLDSRERWVKSIGVLMAHQKKISNFKKGPTVKNQSWRWDGVDQETSEKIRMQNQKILLSEGDNSTHEKSQSILLKLLKLSSNYLYEYEKGIIHGFHKKPGIIQSKQRWFFLCSDFNLQDQEDQSISYRMSGLLEDLNKQKRNAKKNQNQESQDQSQVQQDPKQFLKCNIIYQFDQQTQQIKHFYPIQNLISWEVDTTQTPNRLVIKYQIPVKDPSKQLFEDPKEVQVILTNDYLVQLRKWVAAVKILFTKLGVPALREKKKQKIGEKNQIDAYKRDTQGAQWVQRVKDKKIIVFLTKISLRIDSEVIPAKNIAEVGRQEVQTVFKEMQSQNKQAKRQVIVLTQNDRNVPRIFLFCQKLQTQKTLFKKISRLVKNIQKEMSKQAQISGVQKKQQNQINPKTYYLDKLMKQRSSSIKVNFYTYMQRDPKQHQRKQKPQPGFLDKIMGMFCGNSQEDDLFS